MNKYLKEIMDFFKEEEGLTIVEYAVGGALIAAGAVTAFSDLGDSVCETIDDLSTALDAGSADSC